MWTTLCTKKKRYTTILTLHPQLPLVMRTISTMVESWQVKLTIIVCHYKFHSYWSNKTEMFLLINTYNFFFQYIFFL